MSFSFIQAVGSDSLNASDRIYESIKLSIKLKVLNPGDILPDRVSIAAVFNSKDPAAVSAANQRLVKEGYLANKGRSVVVCERPLTPEEILAGVIKRYFTEGKVIVTEDPEVREGKTTKDCTYEYKIEVVNDIVEIQVK